MPRYSISMWPQPPRLGSRFAPSPFSEPKRNALAGEPRKSALPKWKRDARQLHITEYRGRPDGRLRLWSLPGHRTRCVAACSEPFHRGIAARVSDGTASIGTKSGSTRIHSELPAESHTLGYLSVRRQSDTGWRRPLRRSTIAGSRGHMAIASDRFNTDSEHHMKFIHCISYRELRLLH